MDENNRKAMEVLRIKGYKEFEKFVFTDPNDRDKPKDQQRQLSYAEMRALYG